jgi:hypothetical protein
MSHVLRKRRDFRREFITLLGGAAAACLIAAGAQQQPERMRRIGVLMAHAENDPEFTAYVAAHPSGGTDLGSRPSSYPPEKASERFPEISGLPSKSSI